VAAAVGYRDAGALAKIFTRHMGRKPAAYRSGFRRRVAGPATSGSGQRAKDVRSR
jgi:transcriptional regulator GlxA family with amidase domain